MQPVVIHSEHIEELRQALDLITGHLFWYLAGLLVTSVFVYIFKDNLRDRWAGIIFKRGTEYRRLDQVYFYQFKEIGVIEYIAKQEMAFTMYNITNDPITKELKVTGGKSIIFRNSELKEMHIARFKPHLGDPSLIPSSIINDLKSAS